MNKAAEIVAFKFSESEYSDEGNFVVNPKLNALLKKHIEELNHISVRLEHPSHATIPQGVEEVYHKFIRLLKSDEKLSGQFNSLELRKLSYAMNIRSENEGTIFENKEYLKKCLELLANNWRDSYFMGLLDCCLSNWHNTDSKSFNLLSSFITSKITNYKGSIAIHVNLKKVSKFFNKNKGDLDLGATLALSNQSILEATKFLNLPDHWITYSYFQGVISAYFKKVKGDENSTLEELQKVLILHSGGEKHSTEFNKIIVSEFVLKYADSSLEFQDTLKDTATLVVGDPGTSAWDSIGNETVTKARELLNFWITREFIKAFFEICFIDERRKEFWLNYSKKISRIKVVSSKSILEQLKSNKGTSEFLDGRFAATRSKRDTALMFIMGNHLFIEFSDEGAFYAYLLSNNHAPLIEDDFFESSSKLKNKDFKWLVYRKGYDVTDTNIEGKLGHNDGDATWEKVAEYWIEKIAGINV